MSEKTFENADSQKPVKISRRRANRIAAMQFIYAWGVSPCEPEKMPETLFDFFTAQPEPREYYAFAEELATGTLQNIARIDEVISDCAKNWTLSRIARCDLAILRLAIYELLYRTDIPPIVSINEAIDLAKIFSTEDSHRFVNGMLDRVKAHLTRPLREAQK
ncbi:MAG: transcription antitermination factor NusB [Opitutales bacterium]|nr:transcription antitermination factor NusB [Opitutales bacterium]